MTHSIRKMFIESIPIAELTRMQMSVSTALFPHVVIAYLRFRFLNAPKPSAHYVHYSLYYYVAFLYQYIFLYQLVYIFLFTCQLKL